MKKKKNVPPVCLTCFDCGLEYGSPGWIETTIPDTVWKLIAPNPDHSGILCISCIARRIEQIGLETVPIWICGTERIRVMMGDPCDPLAIAIIRNWEPRRQYFTGGRRATRNQ